MTLRLNDICRARDLIDKQITKTPCQASETLSDLTKAKVYLKFENLQFTASFKERGALNKLLTLTPVQKARGVIAMSAGNHAQAVAHHAKRLHIPATIVMPRVTPNIKIEQTRRFGARVLLHGKTFEEACVFAEKLAHQKGLVLVHPYDDKKIIAGQGTIALEMLEEVPDLEILLVPVGGGGLISGMAIAAKGLKPKIKLMGIQSKRFPSMQQRLAGKKITCGGSTIADGIAVSHPGCLTRKIIKEFVDDLWLVDEEAIEEACLLLLKIEKTVVEGAGACGLAALLEYPKKFARKKVGLVLSGGNIDLLTLSSIIQRGLVRTGHLVRLHVQLPDLPGSLALVSNLLGEKDANVIEVTHHRAFSQLPLETADVEFVLKTRGMEHVREILLALKKEGYQARLLES